LFVALEIDNISLLEDLLRGDLLEHGIATLDAEYI